MRGGTSRGPYFKVGDLPSDPALRDRVLLSVIGSPDARQIDGLGGGDTLTSKVALVGRSDRPGIDVDFLFAQVAVEKALVDWSPSCGNILAGVGPFALEAGLVSARPGETPVTIYNSNTASIIEALLQTPGGQITYDGDCAIDGVPGTAAPVVLNFRDIVGSKCGRLLPTGQVREEIQGVEVTCIDAAVPMMILTAQSLGKTGYESAADLDADRDFFARLEALRREAGRRMGLGEVAEKVIPRAAILALPRAGGSLTSRYFVPSRAHAAHAVTGAICVGACAALEGSVADGLADLPEGAEKTLTIEHPSGQMDVRLSLAGRGPDLILREAGVLRSARKIMSGEVFVPAAVWDGRH